MEGSEKVNAIIAEDVWWRYEISNDWILKGVNLKVKRGEFLAIIGPTGAGKSTLCKCFNGLIPHSVRGTFRGNVFIGEMNSKNHSVAELARRVGTATDDPESQFVGMTVIDDVVFGLENLGLPPEDMRKRQGWALKAVRMERYAEKLPYELSGGQKQRVTIASALAMMPDILILDEPTSELDPMGKREVFSVIGDLEKEITIILVDNSMEEAIKYADRIVLFFDGRVEMEGTPREVCEKVDLLKERGVYPPQVTELGHLLKQDGLLHEGLPITVEEACERLSEIFRRRRLTRSAIEERPTPIRGRKKPLISVRGLWFTYPDGTTALRGVNLEIYRGEFVAITGQNGSGKTTLAKTFNGLLKPTKGEVLVAGLDTRKVSLAELATRVGYVFQNPDHQLVCDKVEDELAYGPRNLGFPEREVRKRVKEVMRTLNLERFRSEHPFFLSKAERQRTAVASVLTMKPEILCVDEPTTGMDARESYNALEFLVSLNKRGHTIFIITHNMRLVAQYASRVIVLQEGKVLLDGSPKRVFSKPGVLETTLLEPPQITCLSQLMGSFAIPGDILTVEEFYSLVKGDRKT